ncbi:MAG: hypothetical protein AAGH89_05475 [Verrucomicrobiota bacterium]
MKELSSKFAIPLIVVLLICVIVMVSLNILMRGNKEVLVQHWEVVSAEGSGQTLVARDTTEVRPQILEAIEARKLAIIEFDDSGDSWAGSQKNYATTIVDEANWRGTTIYVYVHGWNHNSRPDRADGDLVMFSQFILNLNQQQPEQDHVGVYISWPGDPSLRFSFLGPLSFPGRRAATSRLASPTLLSYLMQLRAKANKENKTVVLIGHSFGGRVVERVMTPSMQAYYNLKRHGSAELKSLSEDADHRKLLLADLTILINPATEGLHARKVKLASRRWPYSEFPAIISFTSETDPHTGGTWKTGKTLEEWLVPTVPRQSRYYNLSDSNGREIGEYVGGYLSHTSGHDRRLLSGKVRRSENGEAEAFEIASDLDESPISSNFLFPRFKEEVGHLLPTGGYLVFRIGSEILDGHSGEYAAASDVEGDQMDLNPTIFNPEMTALMQYLLQKLETYEGNDVLSEVRKSQDEASGYHDVLEAW